MALFSGIASTVTNTNAVCTTFIAFLRTHQDRHTEWRSWKGASCGASKRRKMGGKMDIFNVKKYIFLSKDFKLLRKIKENLIYNCDFLNFPIPISGGQCYCSPRTSINPATPLNIHRNSVNINTHKTLSIQQQLQLAADQQLQLYIAKCLLYISSVITLTQSALSIPNVLYQQHNATTELCKQLYVLSIGCFVAPNHTKRL